MEYLLEEYKKSYLAIKELEKKCVKEENEVDLKTIRGMKRGLEEVIHWLNTGYDPHDIRSVTRQDTYLLSNQVLEKMNASSVYIDRPYKTEDMELRGMENVKAILAVLTPNERTVYKSIHADCKTFACIAEEMQITKGTVQSYEKRAKQKVKRLLDTLKVTQPDQLNPDHLVSLLEKSLKSNGTVNFNKFCTLLD